MKEIFVQAQSDHIASLFRGSPLAAVEELIWNALDADAHEVRVDVIEQAMGGVDAIRVSDDGTGIDVLRADQTFGNLGGSWKRDGKGTPLSGRTLHGRRGCGRFRAFALGTHVEWRTTMQLGNDRLSYVLSGDADHPGVFRLDSAPQGPAAGTEVYITNVRVTAESLVTLVSETVQHLASRFALYLKRYPDVRIYFNGLPVTPVIVQKSVTDYPLKLESGAEAKLSVIEWKCRFVGSGHLVFSGTDGFALHEQAAGVRAGAERPFTAYLVSPRFPALHAENALVMDELHPEVRQYLDAAKAALKRHFGERETFDRRTFESDWAPRIAALSAAERKALMTILKKAMKANA